MLSLFCLISKGKQCIYLSRPLTLESNNVPKKIKLKSNQLWFVMLLQTFFNPSLWVSTLAEGMFLWTAYRSMLSAALKKSMDNSLEKGTEAMIIAVTVIKILFYDSFVEGVWILIKQGQINHTLLKQFRALKF